MLGRLRVKNQERTQEWDPENKLSALFFAVELAGEVGEALNVIKKLEREKHDIPGSRATAGDLGEELADIIIVVDIIAAHYGIDLEFCIKDKFNKTSKGRCFKTCLE